MHNIFSLELEKHFLSGLFNNPKILFDLDGIICQHDFYNDTHNSIFSVLRGIILADEKYDKVLLAQKIKNLGIIPKEDINIFSYIESLAFLKISPEATVKAAKELVKLRIKRQIYQSLVNVKTYIQAPNDDSIEEVISKSEALFSKDISLFDFNDEVENVFDGVEEIIEERGNNPINEIGLATPYPEFNRLYGGLRAGNIYAVVSRPGVGKSTWINEITYHSSRLTGFKVPALILDTEMFTIDVQFRRVAALTGVPMWYLETGNWRKNPEMYQKVKECWGAIKGHKLYHYEVANKNIDEVISILRRWYHSKVGRGNEAIIAYDYIKLTGEKLSNNWAEHQAIGEKIDKLKKAVSPKTTNASLICAMQLNRQGESFNRKAGGFNDDSAAISLSDRLQWFASFVGIWRQKTEDELAEDGPAFGTHKLINLKSRFQGRDAPGHSIYVRRTMPDGTEKYVPNYLNYSVENFAITERGSLRDVIAANQGQVNLDGERPEGDGQLM
jgi:replicative DNA helicase